VIKQNIALKSHVYTDEITDKIASMFDYPFNGETLFNCEQPVIPLNYNIGLIVGPSGSGKTSILNTIGKHELPEWKESKAVASHFIDAEDAQKRLSGVGLNSIPTWLRPYKVLSTGEKFRCDMARILKNNACIDEFTSTIDRVVAKSCSYAINRLINKENLTNITFSSCHYDIIDWLNPDWVYDTLQMKFISRGVERQLPDRVIQIFPCNTDVWPVFSQHHYLSGNINKSSRCWIAMWDKQPVGFVSALTFPCGSLKNAWREHRTVILPDYQGIGFGVRISDAVATLFKKSGCRYFSKTAHPRMGEYRNNSTLWKATSKNGKARFDYIHDRDTKESNYKMLHYNRVTYSHEFVG
jgi:GNAT superfamily N-acetyltransferase